MMDHLARTFRSSMDAIFAKRIEGLLQLYFVSKYLSGRRSSWSQKIRQIFTFAMVCIVRVLLTLRYPRDFRLHA
jgi:hypothetical protein